MIVASIVSAVRDVVQRAGLVAARPRRSTMLVRAAPEDALLASAAALRRLGARITRYDVDEGALEARWSSTERRARVSVDGDERDVTRLAIETDGARARSVVRRFRTEIRR